MPINSQKGSPRFAGEAGFTPILLLLLAAIGLIAFLLISSTFPFKDKLFSLLFPKPPSHAAENAPSVPDEILIKFKPGVSEQAKQNIKNEHALEVLDTIPHIEVLRVKVNAQSRDAIIEALKHNPLVEFAEPNFILKATLTPNDLYYTLGRQWVPPKINAPAAWDITTGASSTVIAILDSGVNYNHEDLIGKFIGNPALDDYGHGTRVAGVAGAIGNNSKGVAGICWLCPMLSIKMIGSDGTGTTSGSASAIVNAADQGAKVINMSYGSTGYTSYEQDAVNYAWGKGAVLVGGAGNNGANLAFYPAAYDNVIDVGGTDLNDNLWVLQPGYGSNYGPWIDVVAPASAIYSTNMGGSYDSQDGTSFASPHVAGLAGLILSVKPTLTNQQVVDIITSSADDLGTTGKDDTYGWGRINAYRALQQATGIIPPPPDTTVPTTSVTSPTSGSTISGLVDITANASDNVGVTKVEFYIDGSLFATDTISSYLASWDTTAYTNSSHTLSVKAYDNAGNVGTSSTVTVTVNNTTPTPTPSDTTPPTVSITNPTNGGTVKAASKVTITADASDNVSVSKVEFYVGTSLKCTSSVTPYSCTWSVPGKKGTNYNISAKAYDKATPTPNNTQSASIKVVAQ